MGLFGSKKEVVLPKVSDIFSADDLEKIKATVGPKAENRGYGKYSDLAKTIMQVVDTPDKEFTKKEWNGIIFSAGGLTKLEPELAPLLKGVIEKFKAFGK